MREYSSTTNLPTKSPKKVRKIGKNRVTGRPATLPRLGGGHPRGGITPGNAQGKHILPPRCLLASVSPPPPAGGSHGPWANPQSKGEPMATLNWVGSHGDPELGWFPWHPLLGGASIQPRGGFAEGRPPPWPPPLYLIGVLLGVFASEFANILGLICM